MLADNALGHRGRFGFYQLDQVAHPEVVVEYMRAQESRIEEDPLAVGQGLRS